MGIIPQQCSKCQFYWLDNWSERYNQLCERCNVMKIKEPQRFGRLVKSFGDYGELRKQKKAPNLEVFYIPVVDRGPRENQAPILRSVNNATSEAINDHIKKVGLHLANGAIKQENAEVILDYCYAELNKRFNNASTQTSNA